VTEHTIPVELTEALNDLRAPILSVYYAGDTPTITMPDSHTLKLEEGSNSLTIELNGRSTDEVVSIVARSAMSYSARAMLDVVDVGATLPTLEGTTIDGGTILMGEGHVVQRLEATKIRLLPPYNDSRHSPWFPVVNNGWTTRVWRGGLWKFTVPEYPNQTWSSLYGPGFIDVDDEHVEKSGPAVLKLARTPIHWDRRNLTVKSRGSVMPDAAIRDVDVNNGLVYLYRDIQDNEAVLVTYTYIERGYIYSGIDLNPTEFHNPAIVDRWVVFYLLPHIGPDGYIRSDCVQHQESNTLAGAIRSIPPTDEPVLILGATQVRNTGEPTDIQVTDTRTRGGGVKDARWAEAVTKTREVLSATDNGFFDGRPYPAGLSLFVTLPEDIKEDFNNTELDGIVRKFVEYGTYTFLEFE